METRTRTVSALELWRNPILVRYARSRLRWKGLLLNAIPTLLITVFLFLVFYIGPRQFLKNDPNYGPAELRELGGRLAFMAVFAIQGVNLMLRGTFSVAVGITREGVEGILEYQRLTPMSPLAKIIGYVLGLPIRETVIFFLTLPFTGLAIQFGNIPWELVWQLYLAMVSSVLLYHMTGFLAGIAVKNRFMAGFLSQLLMIVLYLFLPMLSRLGYVVFEYLTVRPQISQALHELFDPAGRKFPKRDTEHFFDTEIPIIWFTLLVQGFLLLTFFLVTYRRVRNSEEHLLGKFSAIPVVAGLITIVLGVAVPGIRLGNMFLSQSTAGFSPIRRFKLSREPFLLELMAIPGLFGLGLMVLVLLVVLMITPTEDQRIKGMRLARKLDRSVPWYADSASSLPTTLICSALIAGAWYIFNGALLESRWYAHWDLGTTGWILFPLTLFVPILCYQLALEIGGKQFWFFACLFGWVVPVMAAIVLAVSLGRFPEPVIYLMSASGFTMPFNAVRVGFEGVPVTPAAKAITWSLVLHGVGLLILVLWSMRKSRELRKITMGADDEVVLKPERPRL